MTRGKWAVAAGLVAALVFAVEGGEYSTWDLLQLRSDLARERQAIADLKVEVDSLQTLAKAIETDPRTQERIAREQFGMLRKGEFLYRLVPPDTVNGQR
ncbi:MAG TPA: septum formation initiator family protein [Gemmatimonadales bacterium]|nr:septum formation initiator family protein [Gemmatimonadales bacterium]